MYHELTRLIALETMIQHDRDNAEACRVCRNVDKIIREWLEEKAKSLRGYVNEDLTYSMLTDALGLTPDPIEQLEALVKKLTDALKKWRCTKCEGEYDHEDNPMEH